MIVPQKVYAAAADLIQERSAFCTRAAEKPTHVPGVGQIFVSCLPTDPKATAWNAAGALWRAANKAGCALEAYEAFRASVAPDGTLVGWAWATTHADQIAALRAAGEVAR